MSGAGSGGPLLPGAKADPNEKMKYLNRKTIEDIPDHLLKEEIFKHLDVASWGCCKAVCRRWRELLKNIPAPLNGIPCLCDIFFETGKYNITDIFERKMLKKRLPSQMIKDIENAKEGLGYRCMGSFGPWLILIIFLEDEDEPRSCLYNPFSRQRIMLPCMDWADACDYWNLEARMSCIPSKSNLSESKCWVLVFTSEKFYACKPNDNEWTDLPIDRDLDRDEWTDLRSIDHYLSRVDGTILLRSARPFVYLLDVGQDDSVILVCDVLRGDVSTLCHSVGKLIRKFYGNEEGSKYFKLTVDISGDLLVVRKPENDTGAAVVLKLRGEKLVRVDDLDGGIIFIIENEIYPCYKGALESGFFVKDCVYDFVHHWYWKGWRSDRFEYCVSRYPVNQQSLPKKISFVLPRDILRLKKTQDREILWLVPMIS